MLTQQSSTYDSWLMTVLLEEGGGAVVWQLRECGWSNTDGFGVRCLEGGAVCVVLQNGGGGLSSNPQGGTPMSPPSFSLFQGYPNPFNGQTRAAIDLPSESFVRVSLYNMLGEIGGTFVDGFQSAGMRKELLALSTFPRGASSCRTTVQPVTGSPPQL